ncbi:unnamed protein product [Staphylococcus haemolyticus JCSC1435]|uniref:Uncharacterized protein n=1 Tax=Staphylococcus haemolyticus (strain JCSC1435) TaxID=279808 RepID=Q4L2Z9_STAHJ|nr:unnamed protein product [Staphylococcus haemolyticus JCSC1435]
MCRISLHLYRNVSSYKKLPNFFVIRIFFIVKILLHTDISAFARLPDV